METRYHFDDPVLVDVDNYPPVDNYFRADWRSTGNADAVILETPPSGRRLVITDVFGSLSAAGSVTLHHGANQQGNRYFDIDVTANAPFVGGGVLHPRLPVDAPLCVTTTGNGNLKIVVTGFWE